ncbi:MAG: hypothetical protein NC309_13400 [Ruminococcus sp.]|nr:hypothetical protein [Ruminococcus sp.]
MNNQKRAAFKAHRSLRNQAEKLREAGHICLLSYRITAGKTQPESAGRQIRKHLDDLYMNRGFYYIPNPLENPKGQIEILLSTVPFDDSKPYTSPLTEKEVVNHE